MPKPKKTGELLKARPKWAGPPEGFADKFCQHMIEGVPAKHAAALCDRSWATVENWILIGNDESLPSNDKYRRFYLEYAKARARQIGKFFTVVIQDAEDPKSPTRSRSAQWALERLDPKTFNVSHKTEITGADGGAIQVQSYESLPTAELMKVLQETIERNRVIDTEGEEVHSALPSGEDDDDER